MTTDETLILNVVVDQCEVVQEFQGSGDGRRCVWITPGGAGGQQCYRGSQALAAIHPAPIHGPQVAPGVSEVIPDHA